MVSFSPNTPSFTECTSRCIEEDSRLEMKTINSCLQCLLREWIKREVLLIHFFLQPGGVAPWWPLDRMHVCLFPTSASLFRTGGCGLVPKNGEKQQLSIGLSEELKCQTNTARHGEEQFKPNWPSMEKSDGFYYQLEEGSNTQVRFGFWGDCKYRCRVVSTHLQVKDN